MIGAHCPMNMLDLSGYRPYVRRLSRYLDAERMERGERINGFTQCPKCGVWWPNIEEPCAWEESLDGRWWQATEWWGAAVCEACDLLMVDQPDGRGEVYSLRQP